MVQLFFAGDSVPSQVAAERLLSNVLPEVSGQFVRSGKLPRASIPGTASHLQSTFPIYHLVRKKRVEKKNTCGSPLVNFEVGAFSLDFLAAHKVTFVNLSPVEAVRKVTQRGSGTRGRAGRREQQVVVLVVVLVVVSSTNRRRR